MARQGTVVALILLLAGCTSSGGPSKSGSSKTPVSGELEITSELETPGSAPRDGELGTVIFHVHNKTSSPIIFRDLTQPRDLMLSGSSGAVATWQYAQTGLLTYIADRDEWTYEKGKRADVRRPVFNSGLLVPDEKLVVRARVRLLAMPMDFQFSYFELSPDEMRRKVYFEVREEKLSRYRLLVGRDLQDRLIPTIRTEEAGHRIVVFPHAEPIGSNALLKTVRLNQALRPRAFTLEQAARKAGVEAPRPGNYTFSTMFDAWVLPKDQGYVLVTPASVAALPELRQMERILYLLDTAGTAKVEIELRAHSAASALGDLKYQIVRQDKEIPVSKEVKEKRTTYFLFLLPEQFPRLFGDLRQLKLAMDFDYVEGGGRLLILNR